MHFRVAPSNRLTWHINKPVPSNSTATLHSHLKLSAGPTTSKSLAVRFVSDGATVTASDFELVGAGYKLSFLKKTFETGKRWCDLVCCVLCNALIVSINVHGFQSRCLDRLLFSPSAIKHK